MTNPEPEQAAISPERIAELMARLDYDAQSLEIKTYRNKSTTVQNFVVIAPPDRPPLAYVADEGNAEFYAAAPAIAHYALELARENERLREREIELQLEVARLKVKSVVDTEKKSEDLGDIMNLRFTSGK